MPKLNALGINIYGGGFTIGARNHFNVLGQWEEDPLGRDTFDLNFGSKIHRPLHMADWPIERSVGRFDFIYANPPCAPWSSANTRAGFTKDKRFLDKRLTLTQHTMETAVFLQPKVFISESVENAYNIGRSHYDQYIELWTQAGYHVTIFLTDGVLHGLPSTRRRFHFIAHGQALHLKPPNMATFRPTTVRDAIWDIKDCFGREDLPQHTLPTPTQNRRSGAVSPIKLMKATPIGGRLREVEREWPGYPGPFSSFLVKRLMWDAPAFTMVGLSKLIHPDGERLLTWREGMRLMSFPDWFLAAREIEAADSVTPLMGDYLSGIARKSIELDQPNTGEAFTLVDWRPLGDPFRISKMKHTVANAR